MDGIACAEGEYESRSAFHFETPSKHQRDTLMGRLKEGDAFWLLACPVSDILLLGQIHHMTTWDYNEICSVDIGTFLERLVKAAIDENRPA